MIQQILDPYTENMFVTPKEVDEVTDNLANIIANGINIAIQPPIENDDINSINRKKAFPMFLEKP